MLWVDSVELRPTNADGFGDTFGTEANWLGIELEYGSLVNCKDQSTSTHTPDGSAWKTMVTNANPTSVATALSLPHSFHTLLQVDT